jgi:hypothetical protein
MASSSVCVVLSSLCLKLYKRPVLAVAAAAPGPGLGAEVGKSEAMDAGLLV